MNFSHFRADLSMPNNDRLRSGSVLIGSISIDHALFVIVAAAIFAFMLTVLS